MELTILSEVEKTKEPGAVGIRGDATTSSRARPPSLAGNGSPLNLLLQISQNNSLGLLNVAFQAAFVTQSAPLKLVLKLKEALVLLQVVLPPAREAKSSSFILKNKSMLRSEDSLRQTVAAKTGSIVNFAQCWCEQGDV